MSRLSVFFNSRVENSGTLAWIGDKGLAPFRYLFNGKTIRIQQDSSKAKIEIHHVASFHKSEYNSSATEINLRSTSKHWIKTTLSVVFLVPGLFFAVFKGLAYLYADVREKHFLAREHLTPINREIGSVANPITSRDQLCQALQAEHKADSKHRPTNALIIHGDGKLTINEDPGILKFNPMKLILEGAEIVHQSSAVGRLDDRMGGTNKWQVNAIRVVTPSNANASAAKTQNVGSIEAALQSTAPRRSWNSCKRYHQIFTLARPAPST